VAVRLSPLPQRPQEALAAIGHVVMGVPTLSSSLTLLPHSKSAKGLTRVGIISR
jgi:hypothetical protein